MALTNRILSVSIFVLVASPLLMLLGVRARTSSNRKNRSRRSPALIIPSLSHPKEGQGRGGFAFEFLRYTIGFTHRIHRHRPALGYTPVGAHSGVRRMGVRHTFHDYLL